MWRQLGLFQDTRGTFRQNKYNLQQMNTISHQFECPKVQSHVPRTQLAGPYFRQTRKRGNISDSVWDRSLTHSPSAEVSTSDFTWARKWNLSALEEVTEWSQLSQLHWYQSGISEGFNRVNVKSLFLWLVAATKQTNLTVTVYFICFISCQDKANRNGLRHKNSQMLPVC